MAQPSTPLTIKQGLEAVIRTADVVQGCLGRLNPDQKIEPGHPTFGPHGIEEIYCGPPPINPDGPMTLGDVASAQRRIVDYLRVIASRIA